MSTKADWVSENFDLFFHRVANAIPTPEREKLPEDYKATLWKNDGSVNVNTVRRFKFVDRAYILSRAAKKHIYCIIEDDEVGLTVEQFCEWKDAMRKRDYSSNAGIELHFCLANKELASVFNYLNHVYHSPSYNYRMKLKKRIPNPTVDYQAQMKSWVRMLMRWESRKKEWENEFGMNMPEVYTLLTLYSDGETKGSDIYTKIFKRAHNSSPRAIKQSFGSLQAKGMIQKFGGSKRTTFRITAAGIDAINRIIMKYGMNM